MSKVTTLTPDRAKIRALRIGLCLSQAELAETVRLHRKTISRIECGDLDGITELTASKLARGLLTTPASIVIADAA